MEKKLNLIFGLIGGLLLLFVNRLFSGHAFIGGALGFVLDAIMKILSLGGLIVVETLSIVLVISSIKIIIKK